MKTKTPKKSAAAKLGRLGGLATAKKKGVKYMRKIGKVGASKRWPKKELSTGK